MGGSPSFISISTFTTTLLRDLEQAAQPLWAVAFPSVQQGGVSFSRVVRGLANKERATAAWPTLGGARMG